MRILGILILIAGMILFWQYHTIPALISIMIGSVFIGMPKKSEPEQEDMPLDEDPPDGELVRVENPLTRARPASGEFRRLTFPVDGVTENNDDGSSRQQILRELCADDDVAIVSVWFDDFFFDRGVQIRVRTEKGCVGMIRQKDIETVRSYFGKVVRMIYLEINSTLNSSGEQEYHAEVVIVSSRDDAAPS